MGDASGLSSSDWAGSSTAEGEASSTASSTVSGQGVGVFSGVASSTGLSDASAVSIAVFSAVAFSSATATVLGDGELPGAAVGSASGLGSAASVSNFLYGLRPDGQANTAWTDQDGGPSTWLAVDEEYPDDLDYARSPTDPVGSAVEFTFSDPPLPVGDEFVVEYRYGKGGTTPVDIRVNLRCEGDLIASWFHANVTTDMTTVSQTLSPDEVASIADPGALTVEIIANP